MAATNAINLYITTCRYVIRSNPHDPETWTELHRYLPYLRQSISCCVCAQVLHIPMGPIESPCQHHVCKSCVGGKMRLKPTCAWCKDYSEFAENPILRTMIQCFKKLCEYLASSDIGINLDNSTSSGPNSLLTAIQDGVNLKDDYISPSTPQLGLFPPKLQKENSRRGSKEEQSKQPDDEVSLLDEGEGHSEGIICSTKSEDFVKVENPTDDGVRSPSLDTSANSSAHSTEKTLPKHSRKQRRKRSSQKRNKSLEESKKNRQHIQVNNNRKALYDSCHQHSESGDDSVNVERTFSNNSLYETVIAEHDYIKDYEDGERQNSHLKVRIRKVEGDHESLVKKSKTVRDEVPEVDPILPELIKSEEIDELLMNGSDLVDNVMDPIMNNNSPVKELDELAEEGSAPKSKLSLKKKPVGCRCGLATPNPGKLTCCGQRCPCYSAFKGCVECRCRGCRNPRGDTPSPHSLKGQLQQISPQPFLTLGPNPQIILTPIKVENEENDMDIDV